MKNKVKTFFKDFVDMYKVYWQFLRKHWFGYIVITAMLVAIELGYIFRLDIKEWIMEKLETKFEKKKVETNN